MKVPTMRPYVSLFLVVAVVSSACALGAQSKPARAQATALELNMNARFGRMDIAAEHVAPDARDSFLDRRKGWGTTVRIADYDLTGLRMKGEDDCETVVKVAWFRTSENDLRSTTIKQKWHDFKGDWQLTEENRLDGDIGLLGEALPEGEPGPATPRHAQFPSVTLGSAKNETLGVVPLADADAGK
jgi:hypothetical protein